MCFNNQNNNCCEWIIWIIVALFFLNCFCGNNSNCLSGNNSNCGCN